MSATPGVLDEAMRVVFTEGYCGILGAELSHRTGWDLVALGWEPDDEEGWDFPWFHVMCRRPGGDLVDIAGVRTLEKVCEDWKCVECVRPMEVAYVEHCLTTVNDLDGGEQAKILAASIADQLIAQADAVQPTPAPEVPVSQRMTAAGAPWARVGGVWLPDVWVVSAGEQVAA